ncbi:hypothetical protein [Anaerotruncus colihominis]|uniref:hypothetical protein n=1 Tax=Anaerotruncus colihominis TaxID=169435 RepID=UPI0018994CB6|nr:hypothetical protein [Anaerotruncus colihominis]MBS4989949.1 hypothetical protein [Anaerotruncus colihominis]
MMSQRRRACLPLCGSETGFAGFGCGATTCAVCCLGSGCRRMADANGFAVCIRACDTMSAQRYGKIARQKVWAA